MDIKKPYKRLKYSKETLKHALEAILAGIPVKRASNIFGIPKTTLLYKARGRYSIDKRPEPAIQFSIKKKNLNWLAGYCL